MSVYFYAPTDVQYQWKFEYFQPHHTVYKCSSTVSLALGDMNPKTLDTQSPGQHSLALQLRVVAVHLPYHMVLRPLMESDVGLPIAPSAKDTESL